LVAQSYRAASGSTDVQAGEKEELRILSEAAAVIIFVLPVPTTTSIT